MVPHSKPFSLLNFSKELIDKIFAGFTIKDLFSVAGVCQDWRKACSEHSTASRLQFDLRQLALPPDDVNLCINRLVTCFRYVLKLDATRCNVGVTELKSITLLSGLTSLNLSHCPEVTDAGLIHVAQLTRLTTLHLRSCFKITDTGLEHIAQLKQLTSLDLYNCRKITNAGLKSLALTKLIKNKDTGKKEHVLQLAQLTTLDLSHCPWVTDTGLLQPSVRDLVTAIQAQAGDLREFGKVEEPRVRNLVTFL